MTDAAPSSPGPASPPRPPVRWRGLVAEYLGLSIALVGLIVFFSLATKHFFTATNFTTIANQIPSAILVATGMTFVLILAEIDLSVGSVLGLCGAVLGVLLGKAGWPLWGVVPAVMLTGLACGAFNGLISLRWRLPSFIVTLGMLEMARGGAHFITGSRTEYLGAKVAPLASGSVFGLSFPFLLAILIVVIAQLALTRTVFGRQLIAIGTNEEAVRLSGIDPRPRKLAVFMLTGFLVSLAAIVDVSRFQSANPNDGIGFELQPIAAVVIGGTSLMGGRGSVISSLFGVLIIAVLNSGLAAMGARDETKRLITGAVIIAAVVVDYYRRRWGKRG